MIPAEVENLQSKLVEGHLAVEKFFAIILQSYELELCQESFTIHVSPSQILRKHKILLNALTFLLNMNWKTCIIGIFENCDSQSASSDD